MLCIVVMFQRQWLLVAYKPMLHWSLMTSKDVLEITECMKLCMNSSCSLAGHLLNQLTAAGFMYYSAGLHAVSLVSIDICRRLFFCYVSEAAVYLKQTKQCCIGA